MLPAPTTTPRSRPLAERCLLGFGSTGGPPMLPVLYNNLKRIVQTDDHVMILVEMVHDARIIRMKRRARAARDPELARATRSAAGRATRWSSTTTNFNDTPALRQATRDLHVVERFTRLDADTLLYRFTVEDPNVWTAPCGAASTSGRASDTRVYEYACPRGELLVPPASWAGRGFWNRDVREGRVPEPPR